MRLFLAAGIICLSAGLSYATTLSLLRMDGTVGSTTFTDATGRTWTATGDVQISDTQAKLGQSASFGPGTGYLTASNANDFNPGNSAFTIDFWIYPLTSGEQTCLVGRSDPDYGLGYDIRLDYGEILVSGVNGWGFNIGTQGTGGAHYVTTDAWHHIAVSATETEVYLFYDGELKGSSARGTISDGGNPFRIGYQANFQGSAYQGYLDEFRYSDAALWTSDFTPPLAPAPIPGTVLLFGSGLLGSGMLGLRGRNRPRNQS